VTALQQAKTERSSSAPLKTEINRPPEWRDEAQGKPEYQKLWWAWSVLSSAAVAVGGMV
jgi:hypothetical protein